MLPHFHFILSHGRKGCERGTEFGIDLLPELSATMTRRLSGKMSWRAQSQIRNVWGCLSTENSVCKAGLIICELVFRFALGICSLTATKRHCFPDWRCEAGNHLEALQRYWALIYLLYGVYIKEKKVTSRTLRTKTCPLKPIKTPIFNRSAVWAKHYAFFVNTFILLAKIQHFKYLQK